MTSSANFGQMRLYFRWEFWTAGVLSIVAHAILLLVLTHMSMTEVKEVEADTENLFKVNLTVLDPSRFDRVFTSEKDFQQNVKEDLQELLKDRPPQAPMEWQSAKALPVPQDVAPVNPEQLQNKGVFSSQKGEWPVPESNEVLESRAKEVGNQVVEISEDVAKAKPEERRRRFPNENKDMAPFQIGGAGPLAGAGSGRPLPSLGQRQGQPFDLDATAFNPKVPTQLADLDRSERDLLLSSNKIPIPISPTGQSDLSKYKSMDQFLEAYVETYHDASGKGYFRIIIQPNTKSKELKVLPKDIVYVLDASGSIGRRTLQSLKSSLIQAIMRLEPADNFNVLGFKTSAETLWQELLPANDINKAIAAEFVQNLRSSGMTNIYESLASLKGVERNGGRPLVIALFSDGRANVGITDNRRIINDLSSKTGTYTSIFSFGAGPRVNHYLLDLLSYRNKGRFDYAENEDEMDSKVSEAQERTRSPILLNLSADYGNVSGRDTFPKRLPDLFLNDALIIYGRYDKQSSCALRIVGDIGKEKREFLFDVPLPKEDNGSNNISKHWALQKIYELVGKMSQTGEDPKLQQEIQAIAKEYGLQQPY